MTTTRLLTIPEAAERYCFPSAAALRIFIKRHPRLPVMRRGRVLLIDPVKWDAVFYDVAR
jgi:hypothetical protein